MRKQSIPNLLTFARVLAVPAAIAITVWWPTQYALLLGVFVAASVTDFFDGYLARKWNAVSPLGIMLDPIADKMLVAVVLIYLIKFPVMPILPVSLIIARELYIAGLREFLALRGVALPVSRGGKWKTALQLAAIALLLAAPTFQFLVHYRGVSIDLLWNIGMTLLWACVLLSLGSAVQYTRRSLALMR